MINTEGEIKTILSNLESRELKTSSHLYRRFPGRLIGEASEVFSHEYCKEAQERPGLVLLAVIMAAHRNYTKQVEPQVNNIRKTDLYSFEDLKRKTKTLKDFAAFCGMNDPDKYSIIVELLHVIDIMKQKSGINGDFGVMQKWAVNTSYINFKNDIIGKIKGIGIATFQHLRMNFGANTVKPDQRVKEVLNKEFQFYSDNDVDYIFAVEYIAKTVGKPALYIDQVFVNYGSGYYTNTYNTENVVSNNISKSKLEVIAYNSPNIFRGQGKTEPMLEYIYSAIKDLDVSIERRNDGGYIAVANKLRHLKRGKNVFTYWPTSSSVAVIILGIIPKRKTYNSVQEMEKDQVAEKIKLKYTQIVG